MKLFLLPMLALVLALPALPSAAQESPEPRNVYPLANDPVSDEPLAGVEQPVYRMHDGRRFHFATEESAEAFAAAPERLRPGRGRGADRDAVGELPDDDLPGDRRTAGLDG